MACAGTAVPKWPGGVTGGFHIQKPQKGRPELKALGLKLEEPNTGSAPSQLSGDLWKASGPSASESTLWDCEEAA